MQTGQINVQTENIFPIIKKFLYSDHEIFLRELVANAVDATQKLKTLTNHKEFKGNQGDLKVEILLDKDKGTLTIRDYGVGMNAEEVDRYINQIALSGAEEFVEKYKDQDSNALIGHFGLGFYSAFMVADKVEIVSRSWRPNSQPVHWECDGSPNYSLEDTTRKRRGTDVILTISEDSKEFLEEGRIQTLLTKYCKFLPVPVVFGTRSESVPDGKDEEGKDKYKSVEVENQINNPEPAWTRKPADLKEEDYKSFYRELYPFAEEPLFNIHLNVDYPFNLTGVLYFPRLKNNFEPQKDKIQLYSNQVFVTDAVENIVPEFLTLLHGVIDSPDIPLNVSRSYLQSDGNVKKISSHISKKVADKLAEMFKENREDFEAKWDDIKLFIQFGMLSDEKFYERAKNFALYKNIEGKYFTFEEYQEKIKASQTDKDDRLVVVYASDEEEQHSFIESAKDKGYDTLIFDGPLGSHLAGFLEQKAEKIGFVRVDSDAPDKLIPKDEEIPSKLSEKEEEQVKPLFEDAVGKEKFVVQVESMSESEAPVMITQAEFMRRMREQQQLSGNAMFGALPETYNLVVNANHPLISKILGEKSKKKQADLAKQAADLALLSQNMLKGEALTQFIKRSVELID